MATAMKAERQEIEVFNSVYYKGNGAFWQQTAGKVGMRMT